jgi:hypothetical protein
VAVSKDGLQYRFMIPSARVHESGNGTFETCRRILRMSANRGRLEVVDRPPVERARKNINYPTGMEMANGHSSRTEGAM